MNKIIEFRRLLGMVIIVSVVSLLPTASNIHAAGTWYVAESGDDSNTCSIPVSPCASINAAIAKSASGDTIKIAQGTYTNPDSTQEVVLVNKNIFLSGGWSVDFTLQNGRSTIDGQDARRGITTAIGTESTIEFLVIQNGLAPLVEGNRHFGGGIYNKGILYVNDCIITGNKTSDWGAGIFDRGVMILNRTSVTGNLGANTQQSWGGGLYTGYGGTTTINNSAVIGNKAYEGGGVYWREGSVAINNSTISGNEAYGWGGGIEGGDGTLSVNNSTITKNSAHYGGGGVNAAWGINRFQNSVLAGNTAYYSPDCDNTYNKISSGGYNIIGNNSGCNFPVDSGDQVNVNPALFLLMGSPAYHPLLRWSPAIDKGNPGGCLDNSGNLLLTDQRGVARVNTCDIGAYEYDPAQDPINYCYLPVVYVK